MTDTKPSLTEFLRRMFDEDERDARQRIQQGEGRGIPNVKPSPARVLADVEAKRRIVERCKPIDRTLLSDATESARAAWDVVDTLGKATLRDLAQPYAAHPEFRGEWAL